MYLLVICLIFTDVLSLINVNICNASPVIAPTITKAPENAYPFVVSIQIKRGIKMSWTSYSRFEHYCGGSLITMKHVLTAAHCFYITYITARYRVLVGSNNLLRAKIYNVESWLTYGKWAMKKNVIAKYPENDIAIAELSRPVDATIKLATLTTASDDELHDQQVLSAGWGKISDGSFPKYMVEVRLNMISHKQCIQNIQNAREKSTDEPFILYGNTFCTNGDPYAVLFCGDSGSPVFWKGNEIIGINESICPITTNFSYDNVSRKEQNLHVDVRLYSDFIGALTHNCTIDNFTSVSSCWIL